MDLRRCLVEVGIIRDETVPVLTSLDAAPGSSPLIPGADDGIVVGEVEMGT
jgi:hypothetical protein